MTILINKRGLLVILMVVLGLLLLVMGSLGRNQQQREIDPGETLAQTVNRELSRDLTKIDQAAGPATLPPLNAAAQPNAKIDAKGYFTEYRLERDRVRSQQIELLQNIVDNPNSSVEARQEAQQRLLALSQNMEQELQLETLIVAKNERQAVLFIQPDSVTIMVDAPQLSKEEVARIGDLVAATTGRKLEQIVIVPRG